MPTRATDCARFFSVRHRHIDLGIVILDKSFRLMNLRLCIRTTEYWVVHRVWLAPPLFLMISFRVIQNLVV